jgi:hypothetical protein
MVPMPGRLIARSGAAAGSVYALGPSLTTIGRDEDNDIIVASEHASRHHAQVRWDGVQYILHDLGSKNATTVNGRKITGPRPLRHGDVIELPGLTLAFDVTTDTVTLEPELPARGGELYIDRMTAEVWVRGARIGVTAKEYLALVHLAGKGGALVSKAELAAAVWPEYDGAVSDYNIEQIISRLRRKLEEAPEHPRHLLTVRGLGYRLVDS